MAFGISTGLAAGAITGAVKSGPAAPGAFVPKALLNASPFAKSPAAVVLKPGETVHFTPGKGYYGAPKSTEPAATAPFTPSGNPLSIQPNYAQDAAIAQQQIGAAEQPVLAGQQAQDQAYAAQAQATTGFNTATDKLLAGLAPAVQGAYDNAGQNIADLARGFANTGAAALADEQQASQQFASSQGAPPGSVAPAPAGSPTGGANPTAFGDAVYAQGGFVPAKSMYQQGAANAALARGEENVNVAQGRQDLLSVQNAENKNNVQVTSQLAALAAKYPEMFTAQERTDIQTQLAQINAATNQGRATAYEQGIASTAAYHTTEGQVAVMNANTHAAVEASNAAYHQAMVSLGNNKLAVTKWNDQVTQSIKQQALSLKLQGVNAAASKDVGYLVNGQGQAIPGPDGQPIPVSPQAYSTAAYKNTPGGRYQSAVAYVAKTFANTAPAAAPQALAPLGAYLARPGLTDSTTGVTKAGKAYVTFDPSLALHKNSAPFATIVAETAGQFNLSPAKARAAVIAAGITPDGVRPSSTSPLAGRQAPVFQLPSTPFKP